MSQKIWEKTLQNNKPYYWFNWIMIEKKIDECRIFRDDWKEMKEGDVIIFKEVGGMRKIQVVITGFYRAPTFGAAFEKLGMTMVPVEGMTSAKVDEIYAGIFNNAQDRLDLEKNGVVAVRVRLEKIIV